MLTRNMNIADFDPELYQGDFKTKQRKSIILS